ncbi:MAG: hypothetical protein NTV80_05310, partial [Verrucomicrobia bacterium]|nr:hypothetical protein [Verrucomicrobiota bacterium]
ADEMEADAKKALSLINAMPPASGQAVMAINNVKQLAYLSTYYAHKVRGATFKKAGKTAEAKAEMAKAYGWWMSYSRAMDVSYHPDSFRNLEIAPDWKYADAAVLKEYTDLGGEGIPECENMFTLATRMKNGAVALEPSGGVYNKGTVVTVTAHADYGYAFSKWGGDFSGTTPAMTVTMDSKKSVTATFVESAADAIPWMETFSQTSGTKSHGAPTSWQAKRDAGRFEIGGGRLMMNGAGEEGVFETADIRLSGKSVKVSLEVQSSGGVDSGDSVRFYQIVDGAQPKQIGETIKGKTDGVITLQATGITGSKLKLRIVSKVSATDEFFYFDNLQVNPQP